MKISRIVYNPIKFSTLALIAALVAGCATGNVELQQLRDEVQRATTTAEEAKAMAGNALETADEAKATASEARTASMETDEKIDRMFKRTMYK